MRTIALVTTTSALVAVLTACTETEKSEDTGTDPLAHIERVTVDTTAILDAHNAVRAEKGLAPFTYDDGLAADSELWSAALADDACSMYHSEGSWGENLYWTSATATEERVVEAWASEEPFYHYDSNTCDEGEQCGHYTQIVWDSTERVGCGAARCPDDGGEMWTCRYDPPGNWVGEKPY